MCSGAVSGGWNIRNGGRRDDGALWRVTTTVFGSAGLVVSDNVGNIVCPDGGGKLSDLYGASGGWGAGAERLKLCVGDIRNPVVFQFLLVDNIFWPGVVLVGLGLVAGNVASGVIVSSKNKKSGYDSDVVVGSVGGVDYICGIFELRICHS